MAKEMLEIHKSMDKDHYLGLLILFGRSKAYELMNINERLQKRIHGWGGRLLSHAGKAVMIQAIRQAIPMYSMSCFKLPKGFLDESNKLLAGFWWGDRGTKKRIH